MFKNREALQAGANGMLLSLVCYGLFLGAFLGILGPITYKLYPFNVYLAIGGSFALAVLGLVWSFSRRKPSIAYGGLHFFFALCCLGAAFLFQSLPVLYFPLGTSFLLLFFIQPILTLISRYFEAVPLKWAREEPQSYGTGYRPSSPEAVYQEDRQSSPSSDSIHEQAQTLYPQSYE